MQWQTEYNRTSCRMCGNRLTVVKTCRHCGEPIVWYCASCFSMYDSVHIHHNHQLMQKDDKIKTAAAG